MRRYSEAVKADVRRRMSPPHRQSVARISEELGIHVITLYKWRKAWRLQGEVLPVRYRSTRLSDHQCCCHQCLRDGSGNHQFSVVMASISIQASRVCLGCKRDEH